MKCWNQKVSGPVTGREGPAEEGLDLPPRRSDLINHYRLGGHILNLFRCVWEKHCTRMSGYGKAAEKKPAKKKNASTFSPHLFSLSVCIFAALCQHILPAFHP